MSWCSRSIVPVNFTSTPIFFLRLKNPQIEITLPFHPLYPRLVFFPFREKNFLENWGNSPFRVPFPWMNKFSTLIYLFIYLFKVSSKRSSQKEERESRLWITSQFVQDENPSQRIGNQLAFFSFVSKIFAIYLFRLPRNTTVSLSRNFVTFPTTRMKDSFDQIIFSDSPELRNNFFLQILLDNYIIFLQKIVVSIPAVSTRAFPLKPNLTSNLS